MREKNPQKNLAKTALHRECFSLLADHINKKMLSRLSCLLVEPAYILDVPCANGFAMQLLNHKYPKARVIGLDPQWPSLLQTTQPYISLKKNGQQLIQANIKELPIRDQLVNMIWSNCALHCINPFERVLSEFRRILTIKGCLMFNLLGSQSLQELKEYFLEKKWPTPKCLSMDLHKVGNALLETGFVDSVVDQEIIQLSYPDTLSMMQDLKENGLLHLTGLQHNQWKKISEDFQAENTLLSITVEIIYGHAWRF